MHVPPRSRGSALAQARTSYAAKKFLLPAQRFFHTETTSGLILLAAAIAALIWANSPAGSTYSQFWNSDISIQIRNFRLSHSLREWINDALMVIFFFVVGLEIKREFVQGELSKWKRASLPAVCAMGGMIVPASLYAAFNAGTAAAPGWGIPMATDIAFALGVLALVGDRVPATARIFLLALATVDDIGAILVIAVFYSQHLSPGWLILAGFLIIVILLMRRAGLQAIASYIPVGVLVWFAVLESGVHATIAGVALGLLTPTAPLLRKEEFSDSAQALANDITIAVRANDNERTQALLGTMEQLVAETEAPADRLIRILHPWSAYVILPLFALANAGVAFSGSFLREALASPVTQGVIAGLFVGKLVGITGFAYAAVRLGISQLGAGVRWIQLAGAAMLGGIGFTVSLFISDLAFQDASLVELAKVGVLLASVAAGVTGFLVLRFTPTKKKTA